MFFAKQRRIQVLCLVGFAVAGLLSGCQGPAGGGEYLAVGFEEDQPLRYQFQSQREVDLELTGDKPDKAKTQRETLDLVMTVTALEANPFGLTTLQFTCESAKATRTSFTGKAGGKEAMESLAGKSYTIEISPTGQLENIESFETLLKEIGEKSIASQTASGQRVKELDMIFDWVHFQLYLWDAVTSIDKPLAGVETGTQWHSRQFLPWPVPIPNMPSREVAYTLEEIRPTEAGREAVITSDYDLAQEPVRDFPLPYTGGFQIKGSLFSVLHSYVYDSLDGSGKQVFNLDRGLLLEDQQQYTIKARASFILPLGNSVPVLTVSQQFSVKLLNPPSGEPARAAQ